jgi:hypothetical protein
MHGAILQLTNMPSLRGAQLERSTGTTLPLPLTAVLLGPDFIFSFLKEI